MPCLIEAGDKLYPAKIRTIYPTSSTDQRVTVLIDPQTNTTLSKDIVPGTLAKVYFGTEVVENALTIPITLNRSVSGEQFIYKLHTDGTTATKTTFEPISMGLKTTAIKGELKPGDQIIYLGRNRPKAQSRSQKIKLIDRPR